MSGRVVPWTNWHEWTTVREWLYSPDPSKRVLGVQRALAWTRRGRLPIGVAATALLVKAKDAGEPLSMGMAIVRLVNWVSDAQQRGAHAQSISFMAKLVGLPRSLVDVRHACTHGAFPRIPCLTSAVLSALAWLDHHYWQTQALRLSDRPLRVSAAFVSDDLAALSAETVPLLAAHLLPVLAQEMVLAGAETDAFEQVLAMLWTKSRDLMAALLYRLATLALAVSESTDRQGRESVAWIVRLLDRYDFLNADPDECEPPLAPIMRLCNSTTGFWPCVVLRVLCAKQEWATCRSDDQMLRMGTAIVLWERASNKSTDWLPEIDLEHDERPLALRRAIHTAQAQVAAEEKVTTASRGADRIASGGGSLTLKRLLKKSQPGSVEANAAKGGYVNNVDDVEKALEERRLKRQRMARTTVDSAVDSIWTTSLPSQMPIGLMPNGNIPTLDWM